MNKSANGWVASTDQGEIGIAIFTVIRGLKPVRLRCAKAVAPLLVAACQEWHKIVEKLEPGEVQGYAYRDVRGGSGTLSNHSSGTAVDIWPSRHPQGSEQGGFTKEQKLAVLAICKKYGLRSGGTYKTAKPDWMHIEIDQSPEGVALLIKQLNLKEK
jgi:hypothetical protein